MSIIYVDLTWLKKDFYYVVKWEVINNSQSVANIFLDRISVF